MDVQQMRSICKVVKRVEAAQSCEYCIRFATECIQVTYE